MPTVLIPVILLFIFLFSGCDTKSTVSPVSKQTKGTEASSAALVKAGEEILITIDDFNNAMALSPTFSQKIETQTAKKKRLNMLIDEALLLREARRRGIDQERDLLNKVEQYRKKLITKTLYRQVSGEKVEISNEEINRYYEENKDRFVQSELIRVKQILIIVPLNANEDKKNQARARAEEVLEKARAGEDFNALVKEYSQGPNVDRDGDLGFFPKGRMFAEYDRAAFFLKEAGDLSDIVETKFGYHIIKLLDRKPKRQLELTEVRSRIINGLKPKKQQEQRHGLVKQLKEQARIEIFEEHLK